MTIQQRRWKQPASLVLLLLLTSLLSIPARAQPSTEPAGTPPAGGQPGSGPPPSSQPTSAPPTDKQTGSGQPASSQSADGQLTAPLPQTSAQPPAPPHTRATGTQPTTPPRTPEVPPTNTQPAQTRAASTEAPSLTPERTPYKTMTLDNGLEVIVIENPSVPLVTIDITVRNGAFTEPDEYAGLSHLYEHMFFKANAAIPSQERFMQRLGELGIVFNGYTSDEVVTYFFTMPSSNTDPGMKFMADAITSPLFTDTELSREREVVLGEFDRNEAQPTFQLSYAMDSALWMPYVSRKQPLGQRDVIQNATVAQMQMIKDRFYHPNNSALIVSGDVKATQIFALAKKYFDGWKRGADPFPTYAPPAFPPQRPTLVLRPARLPNTEMAMTFRGPSLGKDESATYAAQLLSTLLNQSTSRLYHRMVDSGVALEASVRYSPASNTGTFNFYATAKKENAYRAALLLKEELRAMKQPGYFTAEEIAVAKQIVADRQTFDQESPYSFVTRTTARWWSMASIGYYLGLPAHVAQVHEPQLQEFVGRYLAGQPFVLGVGADESILNQLNFSEEILQW